MVAEQEWAGHILIQTQDPEREAREQDYKPSNLPLETYILQ